MAAHACEAILTAPEDLGSVRGEQFSWWKLQDLSGQDRCVRVRTITRWQPCIFMSTVSQFVGVHPSIPHELGQL